MICLLSSHLLLRLVLFINLLFLLFCSKGETREFLKMSTADLGSETDFITFLQTQLEKSDHERLMVVNQIDGLAKHFDEVSYIRTDLADRTHQIAILQQQLSQEALLVQEEREKVARLMNENAVLCAQSDDDRAKIASLIRLRRGDLGLSSTMGVHPSLLGGPAALDANTIRGRSLGGGEDGGGFFGNHLHKPSQGAYKDKLDAKQKEQTMAANGNKIAPRDRCIPAGHIPIRHAKASSSSPTASKDSMSLRSVVTDYANTHPHTLAAGAGAAVGSFTNLAHHKDALCGLTGAHPSSSASSPANKENPSPHMILAHQVVGGGLGAFDNDMLLALQPPLNSQLTMALSQEVETLKTLLDEQRRAYENERHRRLADERRRHDALMEKDKTQIVTIAKLQEDVQTAVKELVLYRHQQQIVERALRAEIEMLKVSCVETQRSMTHMTKRKTQDLSLALEMATSRTQDQEKRLRQEMAEKRAGFLAEKETLLATIVKMREENDKLLKDVQNEKNARRRAEERLRLEKQGAQSEVGLLKHHLRAIEKKIYFSHAKGDQREASSAQLIAALMAQQVNAQQQEQNALASRNQQHTNADDAENGSEEQ